MIISAIKDIVQLRKNLHKTQIEITDLQTKLLKAQIDFLSKNIPFYIDYFFSNKLTPGDFQKLEDIIKLPVIDKDTIRDREGLFMNPNYPERLMKKSFTSGTSGKPFHTFFDHRSWIRKKSLVKLRTRFHLDSIYGNKFLVISPSTPEALNKKNNLLQYNIPGFKVLFVSLLSEIEAILEKIIHFSPTSIYGPPSFIFQLALEFEDSMEILPDLRQIITSSEYSSHTLLSKIKEIFQVDVFDIYGSTEFKEVAWQCTQRQGYHINQDELILEILNDNEPAIPGDVGNIVLTDLRNRAMPLIRYNMYDSGRFIPKPCECGCAFKLMEPKGGRSTDFIVHPNGKKLSPYLFENAIEKVGDIWQYQLIQESLNQFKVDIVTRSNNTVQMEKEVIFHLREILPHNVSIVVKFKPSLEFEKNQKFKLIKRNFN